MESGQQSTKSSDRVRPVKRALFAVDGTSGGRRQFKKAEAVRRKVKNEVICKAAAIGGSPLIELDSSQDQPDALQLHISPTSSPVCSQKVPMRHALHISPLPSPVHHQPTHISPLASPACSQESAHISAPSSPEGSPLDSKGASLRCTTPPPSTSRLDTQLTTDYDSGKKRKRRKSVTESSRKKASDILRMLLKREQTDFSFWKHGIKLKKNDTCSLEFVVKLIHVRQAAKKKADKQTDLLVQPLEPPGIRMTKIQDKSVKPNVYILCSSKCLPPEVVVGSVIRILSPWVETKLPSSTLYRATYIQWLYDAELLIDSDVATRQDSSLHEGRELTGAEFFDTLTT